MISKNIKLTPMRKYNTWDKVSLGSWSINGDSQVYCELKLPVKNALEYIAKKNESSDTKITITHFLGIVMGRVLKENPRMNSLVKFGKIYLRDEVNIFFHVADKGDLSGHCIKNVDKKNIYDIASELSGTAKKIRTGEDPNFKQIKKSWKLFPTSLAKFILGTIRLINYGFNLHIKPIGIPRDPFGGMMITNVGSLGFDSAFVPLAPYTHVPLIFALGKMRWEPVCDEEGKLSSKKIVSICVTFDHRVIDGSRGAIVTKAMKKYFENPALLESESD